MNIVDVPLCKVISGGVQDWALRQVTHRRTLQWENFRSRQKAIFCGVLIRRSSRQAPKISQAGAKTSQRKGGPKQVVWTVILYEG